MREASRLRGFENRVLRAVFGGRKDVVTGNGENYVMRSLMISTPHPSCAGDKIEKNEMGEACSAVGGGERGVQGFGGETCGKETTAETQA
jgi:hypothetical protein